MRPATRSIHSSLFLSPILLPILLLLSPLSAAEPSDPLRQQLETRFIAVEHHITRLREAGQQSQATELAKKLQHARDWLAGKAPSNLEGPELHLVGLYEGQYPKGLQHQGDFHPAGTATVEVQATDHPIILALCSYEPVIWNLKLAKDVKLQKVILSGYHDQSLPNPPPSLVVEKHTYEGHSHEYFTAYEKDGEGHLRAAKILNKRTGLKISTFQGRYAYQGKPFIVGPQNAEWTAQRVLAHIEPLYQESVASQRARDHQALRHLRFKAIHWIRINDRALSGAWADFTPLGPIDATCQPLPDRIDHVAIDPKGSTCYGIRGHVVCRIDLRTGKAVELRLDNPDLPRLSWPCGLTFDTKRRRLVLSSLGGEGYLYAYSPEENEWTLLSSLNDIDLQSLTYSAEEDCYYGLCMPYGASLLPVIYQYDAKGQVVRQVQLSETVRMPRAILDTGMQLISVGRQLALLTPPSPDLSAPGIADRVRCRLIDPQTGKVTYHEAIAPQPASQPVTLAANELEALWQSLAGQDSTAADSAMWKLASAGDQAVTFLRSKFPAAEPPAPDAIQALVAKLGHDEFRVREQAGADLVRMGGQVAPALRQMLNEDLPGEVQARIGVILRRIEQLAGNEDIGESSDAILRREGRAIWVLARIGSPAAIKCLQELASTSGTSFRTPRAQTALRYLGQ